MRVTLGNEHALEAYEEGGRTEFRPLPGQRVTTFEIPDGLSLAGKIGVVSGGLKHLMVAGQTPSWVECEDDTLRRLICDDLGVDPDASRSTDWGTIEGDS